MEKMQRVQLLMTNFDGKTKWYVPEHAIIIELMRPNNYRRLKQWLEAGDKLDIATDSEGRLWIKNNTIIERHKQKRQ
jgi:hypothetical protein